MILATSPRNCFVSLSSAASSFSCSPRTCVIPRWAPLTRRPTSAAATAANRAARRRASRGCRRRTSAVGLWSLSSIANAFLIAASDSLIRSATPASAFLGLEGGVPRLQLLLDRAQLVDEIGELRDVVADADGERRLRVEIGLRQIAARIGHDLQRRRSASCRRRSASRCRFRAARAARSRGSPVSMRPFLIFRAPSYAQVPHRALNAGAARQRLAPCSPRGSRCRRCPSARRGVLLSVRTTRLRRVEDLDPELSLLLVLQRVIDRRAVRRIGERPRVPQLLDP